MVLTIPLLSRLMFIDLVHMHDCHHTMCDHLVITNIRLVHMCVAHQLIHLAGAQCGIETKGKFLFYHADIMRLDGYLHHADRLVPL